MDIKTMRDLYSQIPSPKQVRQMDKVSEINQILVNKTVDHLKNEPIFTKKIK